MEMIWNELTRFCQAETTLIHELGVHPLTARLLVNRNLCDPNDAELFLNPKLSNLHDPFGLPDMDKAAHRIADAVQSGESILVFGDYDVDGVTSTAVYVRSLTKLGANVIHKIPHRKTDGYDLKKAAIQYAHDQGARLIITTDCGIQAREAVDFANSLGLCVIVTDHHEPGATLPDAYAVVNPRRKDSNYPFAPLAGVGVAYKTMQAVTRLLKPDWESAFLLNFLDLVAVGTVADVMPLIGENRIFASHGLESLRKTKKVGLKVLLESAGIDISSKLNADTVGFGLGPRINAVGRLDSASYALDLLLTTDSDEAGILVGHLNECNRERQITQKMIQLKAIEKVITNKITNKPVLLVYDRNWNTGVIGIVAGKLVEQFNRPAIVIGVDDTGVYGKGSARSIPAFDIFQGISHCGDLLASCGGHSHAAGLSMMIENIDLFYDRLCEFANKKLTPDDFLPRIDIDAIIDPSHITMSLLQDWERLEPYGNGNPSPVFAGTNLLVSQKRRIGKDQSHLKFSVSDATSPTSWQGDCVGWGIAAQWDSQLDSDGVIDLAFTPTINQYNGRRSVQLIVKDIHVGTQGRNLHESTERPVSN